MQQSTLKKLSEILGLSISTVSRALKDHPDISSATKAKVKDLAKEMEYQPNAYAVQLRTRQSNAFGILVPSIRNFFYDSFIAAIEEDARKKGFYVLIMQSGENPETEAANLQLLRSNIVKGVFVALTMETVDMRPFQRMEDMKIPLVFVDRVPDVSGYYKVYVADEESARLSAEAIIAKGKKKVLALFSHKHLALSKRREDAFVKVFEEKAPDVELIIEHPVETEPAYQITREILAGENRPDVVFCMGDLIMMGVMKAVYEKGLKVPDDISIISISNGIIPTLFQPQITHVVTSGYKLGKLAFQQMSKRLKNEPISEDVSVESFLVEGGSL
ncbi:MAG: LacI family DNA-binding transcriptional regulator [Chitinophagaceae bacterium]